MERAIELDKGNSEEHEIEAIHDSGIYTRVSKGHLLGLYYLFSWKSYSKNENTWEPTLALLYLRKLISTLHRDHLNKPTATFLSIDFAPLTARSTVKPIEASNA